MPVHFDTTCAMSSSSTSSFSMRELECSAAPSPAVARQLLQLLLQPAESRHTAAPPRAADCPCASPPPPRKRSASSCSFSSATLPIAPRSVCQRARRPLGLLLHLGQLALDDLQPLLRGRIRLALQRLPLDLKRRRPPLQIVDLHRHAANLDRQRRRRLIHQIDRLVRQKPVGDIAMRQASPPPQSPSP